MKLTKGKFFRVWLYFKHGHSGWLAFMLSLFNFVTIQYQLLVAKIPFMVNVFQSFSMFVVMFVVVYPLVATLIGWLDFKRGTMKTAFTLSAQTSPYDQAFMKSLILFYCGKTQEAIEVLQPFLSERFNPLV